MNSHVSRKKDKKCRGSTNVIGRFYYIEVNDVKQKDF